ncbi:cytochrome P450 [Bacillus alkalicellulosilyticus]|uniref:cytochrome P450 n=1 Tax=Alkalihalobacterium alkalicellulosilyticum TaxID=1912214 RepID=UPI001FE42596|nr:cytochrome P450 [Bacillus alkalicellulosilyticus]
MNQPLFTITKKRLSGHLHSFQSNPLAFLSAMEEQHGDIAPFRFGPFQRVYLVSNPDLIKEVLVTKQELFVKSQDLKALKPLIGEGLLTSEKDFHLQQRRLIQPSYRKSHITHYAQDMIATTSNYISNWKDIEERNLTNDMMNITLGIISKTMFSLPFDEGNAVIGEPMEAVMKLGIRRMRSLLPLPLLIPTKNNRRFKQAIKELDQVLYHLIEKRRKESVKHKDVLGILMEARDEEKGTGMSDIQLRNEMMTIFLAGHETTANALSWAFYLLSKHPDIQEKLHQELDTVIGQGHLTPSHFQSLPYTQNIISETMRLYPPAYVIGRKADTAVTIGDHPFKKGDMVLISPYVMHRKSSFFENPNEFIPERFEHAFIKSLPTFAYFPFGGGPRVCIGNHFAMMEAVLVLATISHRYSFKMPEHHPIVKPQPLITLRPKPRIELLMEKRRV